MWALSHWWVRVSGLDQVNSTRASILSKLPRLIGLRFLSEMVRRYAWFASFSSKVLVHGWNRLGTLHQIPIEKLHIDSENLNYLECSFLVFAFFLSSGVSEWLMRHCTIFPSCWFLNFCTSAIGDMILKDLIIQKACFLQRWKAVLSLGFQVRCCRKKQWLNNPLILIFYLVVREPFRAGGIHIPSEWGASWSFNQSFWSHHGDCDDCHPKLFP